jgi:ATP-dependent DNA ligase
MVCEQNLEGIVGKHRSSIYTAAATRTWVKVKNPTYTQAQRRRELFDGSRRANVNF